MQVKNSYAKLIFTVLTTVIISAFIYYKSTTYHNYSFIGALDYYGFTDSKQKQAIQDLFQKSSIIPINATLNQTFPLRQTKEEVAMDIINLLQETQKKFVVRSGIQERWQAERLEWINQDKEQTLLDLKVLGFVDAIKPKQNATNTFCILGSTASGMSDRIKYLDSLQSSGITVKTIILLAGERYVTKNIDGTEEELIQIAKEFGLQDWTKLTETHLIRYAYNSSNLSKQNIDVHVIDTPKGDLPRPTTQTTILKLIEWLKDHNEIKSVIFLSNQPYVKYQKAIIDIIFKEQHANIEYEIIGSAAQNLNELQPILEGLGSYIWASTPYILSKMDIQIRSEITKNMLKELYSKNPLIYSALPQTLIME